MSDNTFSRRQFIEQTTKAGIAAGLTTGLLPSLLSSCSETKQLTSQLPSTPYTQRPLPYRYNELDEAIDAMTMEIHYTKHAAGYTKNLVEATAAEGVNTSVTPLEILLANISKYSTKLRNNAGGHYNHELFWKVMAPKTGQLPEGTLSAAIQKSFGSFETFTTQFSDAAKNRFGSGWAWLMVDRNKSLQITSTPNQDNPLMDVSDVKGTPLLGLDVWEHAYYLRYQNKRADYIANWWKVVNWQFVGERYILAMK